MTSVIIPEGVTYIGVQAFSYCQSLVDIILPESLTYIDMLAFAMCDQLASVGYLGTEEQWAGVYISDGNEFLMNAELRMGKYFQDWSELLEYSVGTDGVIINRCNPDAISLEIPAEIAGLPVVGIRGNAFMGCTNLVDLKLPDTITA